MESLLLKLIIMVGVGLALFAAMRRILGRRGRQDPVLLAGSIVSAGFVLGGGIGLILSERDAFMGLCLGVAGAVVMRRRWRALDKAGSASSGA